MATGDLSLPPIGLGTYSDENRDQWANNVETALDVGYRLIDTAQVYGNEQYVGEGIQRSDVAREDIVLETKTVQHDVPSSVDRIGDAIDGCLERLGVEYVDLLYVHWPSGIYEAETTLPYFDEAYRAGKIRGIGLSNFSPELIDEARQILDAPIDAVQVEMHPLLQQAELVEYASKYDMDLVAYCPLAQGKVFDVPVIRDIAENNGVSPAQVSLAWLCSKEPVVPIPKASSRAHLEDNFDALELALGDEKLARIDDVEREDRLLDLSWGPWN